MRRASSLPRLLCVLPLGSLLVMSCGGTGGNTDFAGPGAGSGGDGTGAHGPVGVGGAAAHGGSSFLGGTGGKAAAGGGVPVGAGGKGGAGAGGSGGAPIGPGGAGPGGGGAGQGGAGGAGAGAPGGADPGTGGASLAGAGGSSPACTPGSTICDGNLAKTCDATGNFGTPIACATACAPSLGCVACVPGQGMCSGLDSMRCKPDGSGYQLEQTCDTDLGLMCDPASGSCHGACATTALERSYIGCEYYPTVTSNSGLYSGFHFAVAVANTSAAAANVKVLKGAVQVAAVQVAPNSLQTINLPWVNELKHDVSKAMSVADYDAALPSGVVPDGAYHLKVDQPVTVYQFNPLEFEIPNPGDCPDPQMTGKCNSFTNDASLLLPINALGQEYLVASAPTLSIGESNGSLLNIPGMLAITGTEDGTSVTVKSTAFVRAGAGVQAMSPGSSQTFQLNHGDVVQLLTASVPQSQLGACTSDPNSGRSFCEVGSQYDLSGSIVTSTRPVVVFGGHDCDYRPFNKQACDHLEQSLFPLNTLGTQVLVTAPQSVVGATAGPNGMGDGTADQQIVRVVSGVDGNVVTLDPPIAPGGTLNKGQYADVPMSNVDFLVKASGPVLVVQYMLGGDVVDPGQMGSNSKGDPSMSLAIPQAQYRQNYTFLAPSSYPLNFVNVIAPKGAVVLLDGVALGGSPSMIGGSGYTVLRQSIAGGAHSLTSTVPFGIVVYGYANYTSYMYPGGLNLTKL